jgi:hypothetical protein
MRSTLPGLYLSSGDEKLASVDANLWLVSEMSLEKPDDA